jgi:hypothetical protein
MAELWLDQSEMAVLTQQKILTDLERGRAFLFEAHLNNGTIAQGGAYTAQYNKLSQGMTMQRNGTGNPAFTYFTHAPSEYLNLWGAGYNLGDAKGGRVHQYGQPSVQDAGYIFLSRDWP